MNILDIAAKFLPIPPEALIVYPKLEALLKDSAIKSDVMTAMIEAEKEITVFAKAPATPQNLKDAFNDAATIVRVGKDYINDGSKSYFTVAGLVARKSAVIDNCKLLGKTFEDKAPISIDFQKALKANAAFTGAVNRLIVKGNGDLFRVEPIENGKGRAIELLTGQSMSVILDKPEYDEFLKALKDGKKPSQPKPPKGPGA